MFDVHDKETRSYNMSMIKSKDTKPELLVRRYLFNKGFRYKLHVRKLPGTPDLVFPRRRTVIFIHGCFWHGHDGCKFYVIPRTRRAWWIRKIGHNKELDAKNAAILRRSGWKVLSVYECSLRTSIRERTLGRLATRLAG